MSVLITCDICGKSWYDSDREQDEAHQKGCPRDRFISRVTFGLILMVFGLDCLLLWLFRANAVA